MDSQKVDAYILSNQKYLPAEKVAFIKQKLTDADESKFAMISSVEFKDPNTIFLISLFLGCLGVDRFMLGETGMGILKLLTCGVCGILTIIDWFNVKKKAKELNYNNLMLVL
ncbi:MAG: TM2 domain-containing protein [Acutalibacteraceae bacterium]|nr:TM2 domain-containing protein [Acutalibacteraceae bacterium]